MIATFIGTKPEMHESNMILIRDGALLPPDFTLESEAFLPGWRMVKNFDGYTLNRKITQANWNFVRLTGEHKARVVGRAYTVTLRKGIARILGGLRGKKFNSLEITVVGLKHFVGLAFLSISANRRHIQGGLRVTP
jgi:hypothetical protein